MIRTFTTHQYRPSQELNGFWKVYSEEERPIGQILIPGCVESLPGYENFQGILSYEKEILLEQPHTILLTFYGVSFRARIFWDGKEVASHYNAYTSFHVRLTDVTAGRHILRVQADNRFGEDSALHVPNDYFSYNGINRPVQMDFVDNDYLEQLHILPIRTSQGWKAALSGKVFLTKEDTPHLEISIAGKRIPVSISDDGHFHEETGLLSVDEWAPDHPALYEVHAVLSRNGQKLDDLVERTGFRTVNIVGRQICINDNPVFPKGFCRHEDVPVYGSAVPYESMVYDLQLMRDLGCNSVRVTHYPSDPRFLDLCDELGFLVWEESHARGLEEERMRNPHFEQQCEDCIREMVADHFNHPSIYVWGILNECSSDTVYGRSFYEKQVALLRKLDSSRPITYASCKFFTDICLDLVDIVSMNLYAGWYHNTPPAVYIREITDWIDQAVGKEKPLIISEFGAGAIYGFHDYSRIKWSEERQSDLLEEQLKAYFSHSKVSGGYIWQFSDIKVCEEWVEKRPKCENNKGIVDRYRRRKMAYATVKKCLTDLPSPRG